MEAVLTTTVGLFGSVHQDEMQQKFGWDDGKSVALVHPFFRACHTLARMSLSTRKASSSL